MLQSWTATRLLLRLCAIDQSHWSKFSSRKMSTVIHLIVLRTCSSVTLAFLRTATYIFIGACARFEIAKTILIMMHILNSCPEVLKRFKWRHDNVVLALQSFLCDHVSTKCPSKRVLCDVVTSDNLIRPDQKRDTIPQEILCTAQRPDMSPLLMIQRRK